MTEQYAASYARQVTRRAFFGQSSTGIATAALASLLGKRAAGEERSDSTAAALGGLNALPHFAPKANALSTYSKTEVRRT